MKEKILNAKIRVEEVDLRSEIEKHSQKRTVKKRGRKPNPPKCRCPDCGFTTNKVREMASHKKLHQLAQNCCIYCDG